MTFKHKLAHRLALLRDRSVAAAVAALALLWDASCERPLTVTEPNASGAQLVVSPTAVTVAQSTVAASPTSVVVGSGTSTLTVTAKDANGNLVSGATVVLAATGSGNTLTQPSGTTNTSGVATGTLSSSVAEAKTVSATINGTAVT